MKICIDVDDVIRDFVPEVIRTYNIKNRTKHTIDEIVTWQISEVLPKIEDFRSWITYNREVLLNAPVIPGALETMTKWKDDGHGIYIATNQFPGLEILTVKWLYQHDIPYDGIFFSKNKSMLNGDVLIDDKISNLNAFKKRKILIDKPWNQEYTGERVKYLSDLSEVFK